MSKSLRIAAIPAGNAGGSWGVTIAPGKKQLDALSGNHYRDLDEDLDAVAAWDAAAVLTLVTPDELRDLRIPDLGRGVRSRFMEWHHLPVVDFGTPDDTFLAAWPELSLSLRALVGRGHRVLVHCKGGLGRAGMVVSRLLAEDGMDPGDAVTLVRSLRPGAVETGPQEAWVGGPGTVLDGVASRDGDALRNRAVGALVGLAVGDAVGTTLEFKPKPAQAVLDDMVGGGPFRLRPGQWTDDTAMAIALGESLLAHPGLDPADLMNRFVNWRDHGVYSCTGECFDIGIATSQALGRYVDDGNPIAGSEAPDTAGNGGIMRLAPVAVRHWRDRAELARVADLQSRTTHGAAEARTYAVLLAGILADAIAGEGIDAVLAGPDAARVRGFRRGQGRDEVEGTGYVVACLHAALWAVSSTTDFRSAVLAAANLGRDADTTAAVAGQIAGALYGIDGIPEEWLAKLAWRERIEALGDGLFRESVDGVA
jgi:ADP-ribosyl-[dinitrogen reductase] hydrolase